MARRLLAFGLAFVIICTPLAGDVCEVVCAENTAQSSDSPSPAAHQHRQHSTAAANEPVHHHNVSHSASNLFTWHGTPVPMSHECRDLETAVTESRDVTKASVVNAVMTTALVDRPIAYVRPVSQVDRRHGPPAPIHTTSPLRI